MKKFCYFCGLREDVLRFLIMKDETVGICDRCAEMCIIVGKENEAEKAKKEASPSGDSGGEGGTNGN